ncbi:ankyrin repeat-containing domain protein [Xylaria bambusicola]|uniref:ankyrin repeat-containing domain protein n=1 Tax=Xylaria bambusicola TaxID=326684 RepID=UPI0020078B10|nr:ankyrin repeat-containing domain protein [Xylaria bambusicola]KAI0506750.1 ankyrin repeat-containing domain protein [Xylaria bambusicola]
MTGDEGMIHQTMNSAGVIRADGHAKVHIGNSYSTTHNYPDSSRHLADSYHTETGREKVRVEFLLRLYSSPYEDRKNRNPRRADGTCEWFTSHPLFQNWQNETSALLWVSADPGCGKSVLSKYLVDAVLPSNATRTTLYFFFKDDFEDQRTSKDALRCVLHQLFKQKPALLLDEILKDFAEEGDQLVASFPRLWDIFTKATSDPSHGEMVCILDALDECVDQKQLINALAQHYSISRGTSALKFLVTSRPYSQIRRGLQNLEDSHPTIHLSGESQEEVDKIAQEITIVIQQRIADLSRKLKLDLETKELLGNELANVGHRTYLWVHLIFAVIEEAVFLTKSDLLDKIRSLPQTVEEAYESILRKSQNPDKAKKILQIVIAAYRPLRLEELAEALAFRGESHRCHDELARDLLPIRHLNSAVRETCGLFIVVQDSQVFLLHQTAREFLIRLPAQPFDTRSHSLKWQHSLDLEESHGLLSDICVRYLLLTDFQKPVNSENGFGFLDYAASNWADHYRQTGNRLGTDLECLALRLCDTQSWACTLWLKVCAKTRHDSRLIEDLPTSLLVVSYFGLSNLVEIILSKKETDLWRTGRSFRTALSWASEKGYDSIVQSLLDRVPRYRVVLRDKLRLISSFTIINQKDEGGQSPLFYAAEKGHLDIVRQLLRRGARVDARDHSGLTPLIRAIFAGHSDVVALLFSTSAQSNPNCLERNKYDHGRTPLIRAVIDNAGAAAKLLLDLGAQVNAIDEYKMTALMYASSAGWNSLVTLLLEHGAQIHATNKNRETTLMYASRSKCDSIVTLLLEHGAHIHATNKDGETALMYASTAGRDSIITLLFKRGAHINTTNINGKTALMMASDSYKPNTGVILLLLSYGAQIDLADRWWGSTALMIASNNGYNDIVKTLLNHGAQK